MYIVILSAELDQSTFNVIDWLIELKEKYVVYNENSMIDVCFKLDNKRSDLFLTVGESKISYDEIKSFWYRRFDFKINFPDVKLNSDLNFTLKKDLTAILKNEVRKTRELIHYKLTQKKSLGSLKHTDVNKIIVLEKAKESSIDIPDTLITSDKRELLSFGKGKQLICKPISEAILFSDPNIGRVYGYTKVVNYKAILMLPDYFPISLFQRKIEKKYELRIFYIDGDFYSMAIFSQKDKKTAIDFRKYNHDNPNRTVPYKLPNEIKSNLHKMMVSLKLNTGSIDMAVDINNKYIFFEVNPIGQFGMTSNPCNYFLDKKIAEFLAKSNEK